MLIVFFYFRNTIRDLLQAVIGLVNNIRGINFKNLSVVLQNKDVPKQAKILLTQYFASGASDAKLGISSIAKVTEELRVLIKIIRKAPHFTIPEIQKSTNNLLRNLEELRATLVLLPEDPVLDAKLALIKDAIQDLRTNPQSSEQVAFPIIKGLSKFDLNWREKDPSEWQQLKDLQEN